MIRILLADDDDNLRRVIQYKLTQRGYQVTAVDNGQTALDTVRTAPFDLLLTDMKMPGLDGIELLNKVKALKPELEVILITAHAAVPQAVQAMKLGAFDFLTKPFDDDQLFLTIEKALRFHKLEEENRTLKQRLIEKESHHIEGVSLAYKEMMAVVAKIAPTDATVLLTGESGSGKEVVARAIHVQSGRTDRPFIAVNCAAIPKDLLESELFGHVKGAFTGAVRDKKGKFELAEGGTLLLDEISELNIELQAKLLRVIQQRTIEPVGSEHSIDVDIRLIAATNKDLKQKVLSAEFREDLYYRLNVIPINVPPLRDRRDDIPLFVRGFLQKLSGEKAIEADADLMRRLVDYSWPGNVRELENLIERMAILRRSDRLTAEDLPADFASTSGSKVESGTVIPTVPATTSGLPRSLHEAEKQMIAEALQESSGNKSKAAKLLEVPRHILVYRMKKYGLFRRQVRGNSSTKSA